MLTVKIAVSPNPQIQTSVPNSPHLAVKTPVEQTASADYEALSNLPKLNGNVLVGDKNSTQMGITPGGIGAVGTDERLTNEDIDNILI